MNRFLRICGCSCCAVQWKANYIKQCILDIENGFRCELLLQHREEKQKKMLPFLEDCQLFLKICGYCAYDVTDAIRYRWSRTINRVLAFWHIYFIVTSIAFICDSRQLRDDRISLIMSTVAFIEQAGAHFSLSTRKSNIFEFFQHFGDVVNQRKCRTIKMKSNFNRITMNPFLGSTGASQTIRGLYVNAEGKTTAIKNGVKICVIPYTILILYVPFVFTVIQKIIIERCASDPITWHVTLKAK